MPPTFRQRNKEKKQLEPRYAAEDGTANRTATRHRTARRGAARRSAAQHSAAQRSATEHSTAQRNTTHSAAQRGMMGRAFLSRECEGDASGRSVAQWRRRPGPTVRNRKFQTASYVPRLIRPLGSRNYARRHASPHLRHLRPRCCLRVHWSIGSRLKNATTSQTLLSPDVCEHNFRRLSIFRLEIYKYSSEKRVDPIKAEC